MLIILLLLAMIQMKIERLKKYLGTEFEIKDLGEIKNFLGIEVARSKT